MKTHCLLSIIFSLVCGITFGQHLIRGNNNPTADADYASLQEANDNAADGDTIYMEGSTTDYEGANISRRLTIIGPGYFLSENDSTQASALEANIGDIYLNAGSAGSVLTGIKGYTVYINADNIAVTRCNLINVYFNGEIDNILVLQNHVSSIGVSTGTITNGIISNNIIEYSISAGSTSGPLQITNNVITYLYTYPISVYNSSIANNIICSSSYMIQENTGNTITNNILGYDGTDAGGNRHNVAMANVFVDYNGNLGYSTDGKWQLKPGSPATGAGVSGVDCGAFGGVTPYVLSGLPALPRIYEAAIAATAYSGEGLSCTIKVKSGK